LAFTLLILKKSQMQKLKKRGAKAKEGRGGNELLGGKKKRKKEL